MDGEQEVGAAAERLRHGDDVLDVLLGEERPAGRDAAEQREARHVDDGGPCIDALVTRELDRTRLRGVAADQADTLEVREVRVDGRGRGEPHLLADLAHGRRVAVVVDVGDEELPDLLLARGERGVGRQGSPPEVG